MNTASAGPDNATHRRVFRTGRAAPYLAILSAGYAATIWGHARFLANPTPRRSHLQAFAEAYMVAVLAAQVSEFTGLARGLW